jgi:hypothetical protein
MMGRNRHGIDMRRNSPRKFYERTCQGNKFPEPKADTKDVAKWVAHGKHAAREFGIA